MNDVDERVSSHYGWPGLMDAIENEIRRKGIGDRAGGSPSSTSLPVRTSRSTSRCLGPLILPSASWAMRGTLPWLQARVRRMRPIVSELDAR